MSFLPTDELFDTSMTDHSWTEGAYDYHSLLDAAERQLAQGHVIGSTLSDRSALTATDRMLVNKLMKEFWAMFNKQWSANIKLRGEGSVLRTQSISNQKSDSIDNGHGNCRQQGQKHSRTDEDRNSPNDERRNAKQAKPSSAINKDLLKGPFACPYRKHDSRKYNHSDPLWRTCALNGFSTIPQLKAHLNRNHRSFQCQRCKNPFADDEGGHFHCVAVESSILNNSESETNVSRAAEQELCGLKKAYQKQSGADRWKEMYQIMFPEEEIPEPYFEAIQQETLGSVDLDELSKYEAYSRRELLRVFRNALEMAIARETRPLEHRMRSRLISMIREFQEPVFSTAC
ncbi:hypothetical protein BJ875DRAFT_153257 [Amylocarpus encephaloides]|uniref:C2H2-type domain-containing protein n=1 Tax=Amylocarpus encephaloides TaxID=45428 RepID=A0A9P8C1N8_9HELO|nr:hypothetical protein BJ875DRAFT_153257 [Amylocarpus encephaloides]